MKKNNKKVTVTIGIPAYNEENQIGKIIEDIYDQRQNNWVLKKIVIVDDGSYDDTVKVVKTFLDKKIMVVSHIKRNGKPFAINEIFKVSSTDIVIILDADIKLANQNTLNELIYGFKRTKIQLVSGSSFPEISNNFVTRILNTGVDIWNYARTHTKNSQMYFCEGTIRAFSKKMYNKIKFPNTSADDVYPYLWLNDPDKFAYVMGSKVYYKQPKSVKDLFLQQSRYFKSKRIQTHNFNSAIVSKYFVIKFKEKLTATIVVFLKNPIWTLLYVLVIGFTKIFAIFFNINLDSRWAMLTSTRTNKNE
jgi:glycosyltransferase involved in cell wall biosynthesis